MAWRRDGAKLLGSKSHLLFPRVSDWPWVHLRCPSSGDGCFDSGARLAGERVGATNLSPPSLKERGRGSSRTPGYRHAREPALPSDYVATGGMTSQLQTRNQHQEDSCGVMKRRYSTQHSLICGAVHKSELRSRRPARVQSKANHRWRGRRYSSAGQRHGADRKPAALFTAERRSGIAGACHLAEPCLGRLHGQSAPACPGVIFMVVAWRKSR